MILYTGFYKNASTFFEKFKKIIKKTLKTLKYSVFPVRRTGVFCGCDNFLAGI